MNTTNASEQTGLLQNTEYSLKDFNETPITVLLDEPFIKNCFDASVVEQFKEEATSLKITVVKDFEHCSALANHEITSTLLALQKKLKAREKTTKTVLKYRDELCVLVTMVCASWISMFSFITFEKFLIITSAIINVLSFCQVYAICLKIRSNMKRTLKRFIASSYWFGVHLVSVSTCLLLYSCFEKLPIAATASNIWRIVLPSTILNISVFTIAFMIRGAFQYFLYKKVKKTVTQYFNQTSVQVQASV